MTFVSFGLTKNLVTLKTTESDMERENLNSNNSNRTQKKNDSTTKRFSMISALGLNWGKILFYILDSIILF